MGLENMLFTAHTGVTKQKRIAAEKITQARKQLLAKLANKPEDDLGNKTLSYKDELGETRLYFNDSKYVGRVNLKFDRVIDGREGTNRKLSHANNNSVYYQYRKKNKDRKTLSESNKISHALYRYPHIYPSFYLSSENTKEPNTENVNVISRNSHGQYGFQIIKQNQQIPVKAFYETLKELEQCQSEGIYLHNVSFMNMTISRKEDCSYRVNIIDTNENMADGRNGKKIKLLNPVVHNRSGIPDFPIERRALIKLQNEQQDNTASFDLRVKNLLNSKNICDFLVSIFALNTDLCARHNCEPHYMETTNGFRTEFEHWLARVIKPSHLSSTLGFVRRPLKNSNFVLSDAINWNIKDTILNSIPIDESEKRRNIKRPIYVHSDLINDATIKHSSNIIDVFAISPLKRNARYDYYWESDAVVAINRKTGWAYKRFLKDVTDENDELILQEMHFRALYKHKDFYNGKYAPYGDIEILDMKNTEGVVEKVLAYRVIPDAKNTEPYEQIARYAGEMRLYKKLGYEILNHDPRYFVQCKNKSSDHWDFIVINKNAFLPKP